MAVAIDFSERNDYIGKPGNMTDEQCYALPVCRIITHIPGPTDQDAPQQTLAHVSCWRLTEEERLEVARTGNVFVKILGVTLFPMSVHGQLPVYTEGNLADRILTKEDLQK